MAEKILIVDDEPGIRKVLKITLEDMGYQVLDAGNGEDALQIFRESGPSIVLTDIKMPGIDGIEILRIIKEEKPETEVIMITGHGDMELAIQSLKNEATDFITKPINNDVLEIALKRANEKMYLKTRLKEHTENLEKLVAEKTAELVRSERLAAAGQAVAGLAHAIKNITGGLTGGAYVLEKGIELDNREYLSRGWEMINRNIDRVKNMALDLLNYAKEREPKYQLCDPNRPAVDVYELMLPRADEKGVALELDLDKDLPGLWLDPEEIHPCLLNLVTNALHACLEKKYSGEKPVITISTRADRNHGVEYRVIDNCCGMS